MHYEKSFLFRGTGPADGDDCHGGRHHPQTHAQPKGLAVKPIEDLSAAFRGKLCCPDPNDFKTFLIGEYEYDQKIWRR